MYKKLLKLTIGSILCLASASLAQAATFWVANSTATQGVTAGVDSPTCGSIASPCATFQQAHDNASANDQVVALNDGQFGTISITKGIVVSGGGHFAGITRTTAGPAISVATTVGGAVTLRGLTLDGVGLATDGVLYTAGSVLIVENCVTNNFAHDGIFGNTSGTNNKLKVVNTVARNNNTGIEAFPTGGKLRLDVESCQLLNNTNHGLRATEFVDGNVRYTRAAGSPFGHGFGLNVASGGSGFLNLEDCDASNNGLNGFFSIVGGPGGVATMRISNCVSTGNDRGLFTSGPGADILSYGNNKVAGNGINGAPTGFIPQV